MFNSISVSVFNIAKNYLETSVISTVLFLYVCSNSVVQSQSPIQSTTELNKTKSCRQPIIEITVSPLMSKSTLRNLDVSWDVGDKWSEGDWVGVYKAPPEIGSETLYKAEVYESTGWLRTGIPEGRVFSETPNFNKVCLGFWAAYWKAKSNKPVTLSCLSTNPRWMGDSKDTIRNLKLKETFIPGTHDSAAFLLAYSPFIENRYTKYVFAQDETILEQLIHGARYLDFRIGHYNGIWWLNHAIVRVHPLEHVLDDIKLFLNNTNEIIILDLHAFPVGFKERETHHKLVKYLRDELGPYLAPPWLSWSANLGQLWDRNKRLVLAYNDRSIVKEHNDMLWWPIAQKWPNVRSLGALHSYFSNIFQMIESRPSAQAWSAMAELTPDFWSVVSDKYQGLRTMADTVNHNVTEWFRGDWGRLCNAVAVDFLRSSGVVNAAISWNIRKATGSNCDL